MEVTIIDKEQLKEDLKIKQNIIGISAGMILTFLIPLIPIVLSNEKSNGLFLVALFLFLLFTLPFGTIIGAKYLIKHIRILKAINNEEYKLIKGNIKEKYIKEHSLDDEVEYRIKYTRTFKNKQFIIDEEIEVEETKNYEIEITKEEYEKAEEGKEIIIVELNKQGLKVYFDN